MQNVTQAGFRKPLAPWRGQKKGSKQVFVSGIQADGGLEQFSPPTADLDIFVENHKLTLRRRIAGIKREQNVKPQP